ncbi:MAG: DUF481 domain-containing protein [Candidatus Omnitrophica bacterium]|nr:DUF481 domain-containing protein [Candidatus Omnitrophota bacterium]
MKRKIDVSFILVSIISFYWVFSPICLFAGNEEVAVEVYLKNGDKLSGTMIKEDSAEVIVFHSVLGEVTVPRAHIARVARDDAKKPVEPIAFIWEKELTLGYQKTSGNTQSSQVAIDGMLHKKSEHDEWIIKGNSFYSSSKRKMDTQKWYGLMRYAFSFWENKWYNFYKAEGDHDRFADIEYRIVPASGVGYWFADTDTYKAMVELGVGFEHVHYRGITKNKNEGVLIPRAFFKKSIFADSFLSQEITGYSSMEDNGNFRLRAETVFENPLTQYLSLRLIFVDEYNSDVSADSKKNDTRFISSLKYSF